MHSMTYPLWFQIHILTKLYLTTWMAQRQSNHNQRQLMTSPLQTIKGKEIINLGITLICFYPYLLYLIHQKIQLILPPKNLSKFIHISPYLLSPLGPATIISCLILDQSNCSTHNLSYPSSLIQLEWKSDLLTTIYPIPTLNTYTLHLTQGLKHQIGLK